MTQIPQLSSQIPQCSSQMMDDIEILNVGEVEEHSVKISLLYVYMRKIETIQVLGWFEHTSDWDPYLMIVMKDGTIIETESGFAEYCFKDFENYVASDNSNELTHIHVKNEIYRESTEDSYVGWIDVVIDDIATIEMINQ